MSEVLEIPNSWKAGVITNKGLGLLSKLVEGHSLIITRAETGAGFVDPELLPKQTAVTDPKQALTFAPVSYPDEGKCVIPCKLTNKDITESYIARQIGIYAEDPDDGEILFYITQVEDEDGGTGIPAAKIIPSYSSTWNLTIYYGMADGVNVTVDPAGAITQEIMEQYVEYYVEANIVPYTIEEIAEALGSYDGGTGDGSGGASLATLDHNLLINRNMANQHTIEAITNLKEELELGKTMGGGETMESTDVDDLWDDVMTGDTTTTE